MFMLGANMGKYRNYQQLMKEEQEGRDFLIHVREGTSDIAVIAPHGGGIEPGTMELADEIADSVHSFYCFEGIKKTKSSDLHITSEHFNEPQGVDIVKRSKTILAIHGCKEDEEVVYLGGLNTGIKEKIRRSLTQAGFAAEKSARAELLGESRANICNRCHSGSGVQLEISKGLRKRMFVDFTRQGRENRTETFYKFVSVIREVFSG